MRLDQEPPLLRLFKCDLRNGVVLHGKHRLNREGGIVGEKIVRLEGNLRGEDQHYGDHDHGKRKADRFLRDFREEDMRMDYDLFDRIGEHSTVGIGTFCVEEMLKTGFRKEQIDLGLAFYVRPTDESPYWYDYIDYYDKIDRFGYMEDEEHGVTASFNTPLDIYLKTMWCKNNGIGGVFAWHDSCDVPADNSASLFNQVIRAKNGLPFNGRF